MESAPSPVTSAAAGVDITAGDEAVDRIKAAVASTTIPGVLGGIGGFGGLFELDLARFSNPVLVAATDGVGTKIEIAKLTGRYDSIGIDLVAMCVDDLVCVGATPLFMLDYVAVESVDPSHIEAIVTGVADGCRQAGCALLGGEIAEHGGLMHAGDFDVAGFAVGVVSKGTELGPDRVEPGDVLIGLHSPGLRSNGYTLARHVLLERAGLDLGEQIDDETTLADELLRPSVIYAPGVLEAKSASAGGLHAAAHITGGGLAGNLFRALPATARAVVDLSDVEVPSIFGVIERLGPVEPDEMARVFNLGIGMVLAVAPTSAQVVMAALEAHGVTAQQIGHVEEGERGVVVR